MKKLLIVAIAAGMMTTSVMAGESTIDKIWVQPTKTVLYFTNGKSCFLDETAGHTADYIQRMMATALTAKSSNATININFDGVYCKNMFIL